MQHLEFKDHQPTLRDIIKQLIICGPDVLKNPKNKKT